MSIGEIFNYLKNKKWNYENGTNLAICILIASFLTTPLLGVFVGLAAYLYFYDEEFMKIWRSHKDDNHKQ
ncbi:VraH family protein [Staphylococcus massiliensis]|uniref:VraH family peptide resistance protein n=1 Tax=Staphylococcus massiliensis TaxID=555791 RepID=UPI001EDDD0AB|nr:VraH family protein [Staphylococcus massiliensis]MCG3402146.1 VraH family protein [Staphylococcus massiliensis]